MNCLSAAPKSQELLVSLVVAFRQGRVCFLVLTYNTVQRAVEDVSSFFFCSALYFRATDLDMEEGCLDIITEGLYLLIQFDYFEEN